MRWPLLSATAALTALAMSGVRAAEVHTHIGTLLDYVDISPYLQVCATIARTPNTRIDKIANINGVQIPFSFRWQCIGHRLFLNDGGDACQDADNTVRCFGDPAKTNWISVPGQEPPASRAPPTQSVPSGYRAAVLIQSPSESGGVKAYVGTVVWRRDSIDSGPNRGLSGVIRADIDVPDAGLKTSMTIEKNFDTTLSASLAITIRFGPATNSAVGNVQTVHVPEMRRDDAPRGAPLQGVEVGVAPNLFLVGLYSSAEAQNVDMIRNLSWFDIPMRLANGRIAKVTFEKGAVGRQIINEVFNEWQSQPGAPQSKE